MSNILTEQERKFFNHYYTKCEYDDECSNCDNPTDGNWATGYDPQTGEIDDVFCGRCAKEATPKQLENFERMYNRPKSNKPSSTGE